MPDLTSTTWSSLCDTLESRNEEGTLTANIAILNREPTSDDMGDFDRMLVFVTGKVRGGMSNINRTKVLLTEENNYTEIHPGGRIEHPFEETDINSQWVRYQLIPEGIRISKADALTAPGTYTTIFALIGEDWAEVFEVTIVITVPLGVRYGNITARHGQTLTVTFPAPNHPLQYLQISGSRSWFLEGVDPAKLGASPAAGQGFNNSWDSTTVTLSRPAALVVTELITTTFRVVAQGQWVDVIVNFIPPITGRFVNPRTGEEGAVGIEDVFIYL